MASMLLKLAILQSRFQTKALTRIDVFHKAWRLSVGTNCVYLRDSIRVWMHRLPDGKQAIYASIISDERTR